MLRLVAVVRSSIHSRLYVYSASTMEPQVLAVARRVLPYRRNRLTEVDTP